MEPCFQVCYILSPARLLALARLHSLLHSASLTTEEDTITWYPHSSGSFTVRSMYSALRPCRPMDVAAIALWSAAGPLKVQITSWLALMGRLPTLEYMSSKSICPIFMCYSCGSMPEAIQHIFLPCPFALKLWAPFKAKFRLCSWPISVREMWGT